MPSKQTNIFKEVFDSIVFLSFIALLSVAATKASAWEQEMCGPRPFVQKVATKADAPASKIVLSSRE
jgi:hypothetical protein